MLIDISKLMFDEVRKFKEKSQLLRVVTTFSTNTNNIALQEEEEEADDDKDKRETTMMSFYPQHDEEEALLENNITGNGNKHRRRSNCDGSMIVTEQSFLREIPAVSEQQSSLPLPKASRSHHHYHRSCQRIRRLTISVPKFGATSFVWLLLLLHLLIYNHCVNARIEGVDGGTGGNGEFHERSSSSNSLRELIEGSPFNADDGVVTPAQSVGGFVDTTTCYTGLILADEDQSGGLSRDEYVTFLQMMSPPGLVISQSDGFVDLPLLLQSNYYLLACLCSSRGGDDRCCLGVNATIDIAGVVGSSGNNDIAEGGGYQQEDSTPTSALFADDEESYLFMVCWLTSSTIDRVIEDSPPTPLPPNPPTPTTPFPVASSAPSSMPSIDDSESPSSSPTIVESASPSEVPSDSPTLSPSLPDSEEPSKQPSEAPSEVPSEVPSEQPSEQPSEVPSLVPSLPGTLSPTTTISSSSPTITPTSIPSESPITSKPTQAPDVVDTIARTSYSIVVTNGLKDDIPSSQYSTDLIEAMDIVAVEIADQVDEILDNNTRKRTLRTTKRRKLQILVDLPTSVEDITDSGGFTTNPILNEDGIFTLGACPVDLGNPETDRCEEVSHSIKLVSTGRDPVQVQVVFEAELADAIVKGKLQDALDLVNPDSVVKILSGRASTGGSEPATITDAPVVSPPNVESETPPDGDGGEGLSTGATIGVIVGAAGAACLMASFCFVSRRSPEEKEVREIVEPVPAAAAYDLRPDESEPAAEREKLNSPHFHSPASSSSLQQKKVGPSPLPAAPQRVSSPTQSQTPPRYQKSSDSSSFKKDSPSKSSVGSPSKYSVGSPAKSTGGISHESNSGWSDVYASSMGTMESDDIMPGTEFVDIQDEDGALQPVEQPNAGITNMEDLQSAITAGDWAAVGASAALMASSQYDSGASKSESQSKSKSTFSNFSSVKSNTSSWNTGLDPKKAAELDNLIESGNWEAVIQAAAQFEAEANSEAPSKMETDNTSDQGSESDGARSDASSTTGSQSSSNHPGSPDGSTLDSTQESSRVAPSTSTMSYDTEKQKSREEMRTEVRDLVERVVPEELDHVDEMMAQFLGREEELLETLRTMQERDIAQKSRRAEQNKAKLEQSDRAERDQRRVAAIHAANARRASEQQQPQSQDESPSDMTGAGSSEATGNASSLQSEQTDEAANLLTSASSSSDDRTRHRNALYAAIDAGLWDAVGEAAAILSDTDGSQLPATFESSRSGSTSGNRMRSRREEMSDMIEQGDWVGVVVAASRYSEEDARAAAGRTQNARQQQLEEEKEARRQATLWMEIAKQSKAAGDESEDDAGAVDATDWAIAQSLKRLEKDEKDFKKGWDSGDDESTHDESI